MGRRFVHLLSGCGLAALGLNACAGQSPDDRYRQALSERQAGETATYYQEILQLAAEQPSSRAGRRARTLLQGNAWLGDLALLSSLASNLQVGAQPAAAAAAQDEAQQTLRAIAAAQKAYFATHRAYCTTFEQCGMGPLKRAHYYYFLRDTEVAGGSDSQATVELEPQIRALLKRKKIHPRVVKKHFFCVAAGANASGMALDAWAIDEKGKLTHLAGDGDP
jgi:hypothetical protein